MEVVGNIHLIGDTLEVGSNGFTKRLVVIETDEQYKQQIPIDFVKDKTFILDKYKIGDSVRVSINLRGNEYKGKYYVNLQGWRIEELQTAPSDLPQPPPVQDLNGEPDDLPF